MSREATQYYLRKEVMYRAHQNPINATCFQHMAFIVPSTCINMLLNGNSPAKSEGSQINLAQDKCIQTKAKKNCVHLIIYNVPSGPRLSLRQHSTTQWPTMCIARQDYAHATKLLSAVVDLGHCQKGRQAVVQVKPKGQSSRLVGYSRSSVFRKGTMSQSLPARGLGSAVTSPRDVRGRVP